MRIDAPWDSATVKALNAYQRLGHFHPFTCPHAHDGDRDLIATPKGWICRHCEYTQNWTISGAVDIGKRVAA